MRRLLLLPLLLSTLACTHTPRADVPADIRQLLALHEAVLQAHRDSDVDALLGTWDGEFVMANRGQITRPSLADRRARLGPYLSRTRFSVYRDQVPPVVRVSADGTLGWVIVQVEAKGIQTTETGEEPLEFVSAWIELYEKHGGRWVSVGNLSNFKP